MISLRTEKEKTDMIDLLEKSKQGIAEYSKTGDNMHEGIVVQQDVIRREMDDNEVSETYSHDPYAFEMAMDAVSWLSGEKEDLVEPFPV